MSIIPGVLGKYSIAQVFEYIDSVPINNPPVMFFGHEINFRCTKLLNFRTHGIVCVRCGSRGAFFSKEGKGKRAHLNLYSFDVQGKPIMMTRDHIKPRSKGGTNRLYNMQTMCENCNKKKGDEYSLHDRVKYIFRKIKYSLRFGDYSI